MSGSVPASTHAAILACAALDRPHRALYVDLVSARLGNKAGRALENVMPLQHLVSQSNTGKRIYAEGRAEGPREGRNKGREEA